MSDAATVVRNRTTRVIVVAALALLLAVPAGITLERVLSSDTASQPAATTNAPTAGVPHWKFVEINQMPEAASDEPVVQRGGRP